MLIDTHCHLAGLSDLDVENMLGRAREAGVTRVIAIGSGYGFEDNIATLDLARNRPGIIFSTLAMHPHEAANMTEEHFMAISRLAAENPEVVAIGETGLDYHYMHSPKTVQQAVFNCFIQLAASTNKPLVVHDRECQNSCVLMIKAQGHDSVRGVVHCFSGNEDLARQYLDMGFMISFTGVLTFKKSHELRDIAKWVPLDRILIETDSPFLAPVPHRGKPNQPAYVRLVAECLAKLRSLSFEDVARITTENAERFFGLPQETAG